VKSSGAGAMTMHGGCAFSPRLAVLADFEVMGPYNEGFTHFVDGAVVRYWPARRLWVEAGPATGDLGYAYSNSTTKDGAITGGGFIAAAGVTVVDRPKWALDVQARYDRIWY